MNLVLEVGPKRKDGFHTIWSIVDKVSLFDIVTFEPSQEDSVRFHSPWEIPAENTVSAALEAMRKASPDTPRVRITVEKHIPPGTGLGGGSSDAACVLKTLSDWWLPSMTQSSLIRIAARIGSDVPLFLSPGRLAVSGRGERIRQLPAGPPLRYLLALPPFPVNTRESYAEWDRLHPRPHRLTDFPRMVKMTVPLLRRGDWRALEPLLHNSLQEASERVRGELHGARRALERAWGRRFSQTGSGAALFCLLAPDETPVRELRSPAADGWRFVAAESWMGEDAQEGALWKLLRSGSRA